jgi:hypothetical protein
MSTAKHPPDEYRPCLRCNRVKWIGQLCECATPEEREWHRAVVGGRTDKYNMPDQPQLLQESRHCGHADPQWPKDKDWRELEARMGYYKHLRAEGIIKDD